MLLIIYSTSLLSSSPQRPLVFHLFPPILDKCPAYHHLATKTSPKPSPRRTGSPSPPPGVAKLPGWDPNTGEGWWRAELAWSLAMISWQWVRRRGSRYRRNFQGKISGIVRQEEQGSKSISRLLQEIIFWPGWLGRWVVRPLTEMCAQKEEQVGRDGSHNSRHSWCTHHARERAGTHHCLALPTRECEPLRLEGTFPKSRNEYAGSGFKPRYLWLQVCAFNQLDGRPSACIQTPFPCSACYFNPGCRQSSCFLICCLSRALILA